MNNRFLVTILTLLSILGSKNLFAEDEEAAVNYQPAAILLDNYEKIRGEQAIGKIEKLMPYSKFANNQKCKANEVACLSAIMQLEVGIAVIAKSDTLEIGWPVMLLKSMKVQPGTYVMFRFPNTYTNLAEPIPGFSKASLATPVDCQWSSSKSRNNITGVVCKSWSFESMEIFKTKTVTYQSSKNPDIDCIMDSEETAAIFSNISDMMLLAMFEGLRVKNGEQWTKEEWAKKFPEFRSEINKILIPIQKKEAQNQKNNFSKVLRNAFSDESLTKICHTLTDPIMKEFFALSKKSTDANKEFLYAKTLGETASKNNINELEQKAKNAEMEITHFLQKNKSALNKLNNDPTIIDFNAVFQKNAATSMSSIQQAVDNDKKYNEFIEKWENKAKSLGY